jgi:hypothetical protein
VCVVGTAICTANNLQNGSYPPPDEGDGRFHLWLKGGKSGCRTAGC